MDESERQAIMRAIQAWQVASERLEADRNARLRAMTDEDVRCAAADLPALHGSFRQDDIVRAPRIGLRCVCDVKSGGTQGFDNLAVDSLVRVQLQAALGSSG